MINNYEIRKIDNKEILYIYLDLKYEFGDLGNLNQKTDIKKLILNYIKNNKIDFKGTIIAILVSGVVIGNLVLNKPIDNYNSDLIPKIIETSKIFEMPNIEINDKEKQEYYVLEENNSEINNKIDEKSTMDVNINLDINNKEKIVKNDIQIPKESNTIEETKKVEEPRVAEVKEEVIDNNIYVNVKKNGEMFKIELEEYLIGVVGAEMPASFHQEALKSQAVVARTYALKAISTGKTLTSTESTQSYKTNEELKNMWGGNYNTYYNKVKNAVISTKGVYLTYNGNYIEAVYHSTSNKKTESSLNVWGNYYPYLVSVDSSYDDLNPSFLKTVFFSFEELSNKLETFINQDTNFNNILKSESGRVAKIIINDKEYTGVLFRNTLGLRSTDFTIDILDNGVNITTKGYGHGVGMSQYGANGMAKNGYLYQNILKHYYPGIDINYS